MKLDTIASILKHHLSRDGAPPLMFDESVGELVPKENSGHSQDPTKLPADKVLLYSFFRTNHQLISTVSGDNHLNTSQLNRLKVLNGLNIAHISMQGNHSPEQRAEKVEQFKRSGRDGPRVLLVSSIGGEGLNLPMANILIIIVRFLFSYHKLIAYS